MQCFVMGTRSRASGLVPHRQVVENDVGVSITVLLGEFLGIAITIFYILNCNSFTLKGNFGKLGTKAIASSHRIIACRLLKTTTHLVVAFCITNYEVNPKFENDLLSLEIGTNATCVAYLNELPEQFTKDMVVIL